MPIVTPSIGKIGQPKNYFQIEPPMTDLSKAPSYRRAGLSSRYVNTLYHGSGFL